MDFSSWLPQPPANKTKDQVGIIWGKEKRVLSRDEVCVVLGKELNSVPSGAIHQTGTMKFMSIEVFQGKGWHDLVSFFYVFI